MSYGWLSETTLSLKKPKEIRISDKSNEPLRKIINDHISSLSKDRSNNKRVNTTELDDIGIRSKSNRKTNSKTDINKGVESRAKKDRELKRESGYKRVLAKKAELYEKLGKVNLI